MPELICLAMLVYYEARSESVRGQVAVAQVAMQRTESPRYPSTVCDVVKQGEYASNGLPIRHKCQFSFWCDGLGEVPRDARAWRRAKAIASIVYNGYRIPELSGALNYHAAYARRREWMAELVPVAIYGQHVFYIHGPGK